MINRKIISTRSAVKAAVAATLLTAALNSSTALAESITPDATLLPGNGMSFVIGSKRATTYFRQDKGECEVTVMVSEAEPMLQKAEYVPASRLRMKLTPGKVTRIDTFEGKSLSLTCNADAGSMTVENKPLKVSNLSQ